MKEKKLLRLRLCLYQVFLTVTLLVSTAATGWAQAEPDNGKDPETIQKRIERARALAAAHQLTAAASELESVRAASNDEAVRNVSSVMLMGIYLEDGNYARAESLLEDTFKARSSQNDASVRTYFALAGQALNGARFHLARYQTFGVNVSSAGLPPEAVSDLDRLRSLLERMTAQAKQVLSERPGAYEGLALLEDVLGVRATLARSGEDRVKWEGELARVRQDMAASHTQIASIGVLPGLPNRPPPSADPPIPAEGNLRQADTAPADSVARQANDPVPQNQTEAPAQSSNADPAAFGPAEPKILEVGSLLERATKRVIPAYPPLAKTTGTYGLVRVKVLVDQTGAVAKILWVEGPSLLTPAATEAARQWTFEPLVADGRPVFMAGYLDFAFSR